MERTKTRSLFIVRSRPKSYSLTKQQIVFKQALEYCEIKKGISRDELVSKMMSCIPEFFRNKREKIIKGELLPPL